MVIHPGLIASEFFWFDEEPYNDYSFRVWLWQNQEDLKRWAERHGNDNAKPGYYDDAIGLHRPAIVQYDTPGQHLGEIHFIMGRWSLETVAHECLHGLFHFIGNQCESFPRILYRQYSNSMDWEEEICYPFGRLVDEIYHWLWKKNPNPKWQKEKK